MLPADDLYASDTLYPGAFPKHIDYILVEDGKISISIDNRVKLFKTGSMGLFSEYNTIYATKDADLEIEYSANFLLVDSLAFLQGKATTTKRFKILEDGSIEANNGYFSGRIEADSGYFKGTIEFENIYDENGKPIYDIVTKITRDTVTTAYVNALKVQAGSVRAEDITGTYISGKHISGSTIDGGTIRGSTIDGGRITVGSLFEVDSYGNATLRSLKAYNAEIHSGKIGGLDISDYGVQYGKRSINDTSTGIYVGSDGIAVGYQNSFKVTSQGDVTIGDLGGLSLSSSAVLSFGSSANARYTAAGVYLDAALNYTLTRDGLKMYSTIYGNGLIKFDSSGTIRAGYYDVMAITSSYVSITSDARIGASGKRVGFFGSSGEYKQSVSTISDYNPTVSTVANKVNALINALKAYNLI